MIETAIDPRERTGPAMLGHLDAPVMLAPRTATAVLAALEAPKPARPTLDTGEGSLGAPGALQTACRAFPQRARDRRAP